MTRSIFVRDETNVVRVPAGPVELAGNLQIPSQATGMVLFAHGSGSGRHSPRNQFVAAALNQAGLATLLLDLLTAEEEEVDRYTAELRFDVDLLARRLIAAADWVLAEPATRSLRLGFFGASTGAAAALIAASERPDQTGAVVSRGGRPDLAGPALARVRAPTLLIVGSLDVPVIELNQRAAARLYVEKRIEIVPGASHLFEEPGVLEEVARLASEWFTRYLAG